MVTIIMICISLLLLIVFFQDVYDMEYLEESYMVSKITPTIFNHNITLYYLFGFVVFFLSFGICLLGIFFLIVGNKVYFRIIVLFFIINSILLLYNFIMY